MSANPTEPGNEDDRVPVLLEPPPPGAIADYQKERVVARLDGKVRYFLVGSFLGVTLLSIRGWLPGTGRRDRL